VDILPGIRLASHGWIEECMLLANQATARYIEKFKVPGLYRVHEPPDFDTARELWALYGDGDFPESSKIEASDETYVNPAIQKFYEKLLNRDKEALPAALQRKILQSMRKAQYDARSLGHFALGWPHYAHFTSPIRRYADLWTHRWMKEYLHRGKIAKSARIRAVSVALDISEREIEIQKTERKGMRTAMAFVMRKHVGEVFEAEISGAESFGIFVAISNPFAEGLVPMAKLWDDYYEKVPDAAALVGRRTGKRLELGQKITVKLIRSDPFSAQIDFEMVKKTS
jgi:ribonuclease R